MHQGVTTSTHPQDYINYGAPHSSQFLRRDPVHWGTLYWIQQPWLWPIFTTFLMISVIINLPNCFKMSPMMLETMNTVMIAFEIIKGPSTWTCDILFTMQKSQNHHTLNVNYNPLFQHSPWEHRMWIHWKWSVDCAFQIANIRPSFQGIWLTLMWWHTKRTKREEMMKMGIFHWWPWRMSRSQIGVTMSICNATLSTGKECNGSMFSSVQRPAAMEFFKLDENIWCTGKN